MHSSGDGEGREAVICSMSVWFHHASTAATPQFIGMPWFNQSPTGSIHALRLPHLSDAARDRRTPVIQKVHTVLDVFACGLREVGHRAACSVIRILRGLNFDPQFESLSRRKVPRRPSVTSYSYSQIPVCLYLGS